MALDRQMEQPPKAQHNKSNSDGWYKYALDTADNGSLLLTCQGCHLVARYMNIGFYTL